MKQKKIFISVIIALITLSVNASDAVRSDSLMASYIRSLGINFSTNNRVILLDCGEKKFEDLFTAIRQAKHSIHLEYFNFRNDSIGNLLLEILEKKSREGVEVRVLFDGFGNCSNNKPYKKNHLKIIRDAGGEIYEFDPMRFPWINHAFHRDHRKIAIIDGLIAYTGGMNVADYYIDGGVRFEDWRDMHIRIEGEAVGDLQGTFIAMWYKVSGKKLFDAKYYPCYRDAKESFTYLLPDTTSTAGNKMVAILNRVPYKTPKVMRQLYSTSIDNAQKHIQIVNPYFTLVKSVRRSIRRAVERGVKVEIMVSKQSDIKITPDVVAYNVNKLMKRGANIYYYNNGFNHSKVMMVDSLFCTVGSANLNSRSLCFDYETNALILDRETTIELSKIFDDDKKNSTLLTPEEWKKIPLRRRIAGWFFRVLAPLI